MSEQLFPDATTVAPVTLAGDGAPEGSPRRRHTNQRLSIAALVLGSIAILGDLVILVLGLITVTRAEPTSEAELLTAVLIVFGAIAAFWLGLLLAVFGIVCASAALVRRQRRGPAIIGLVLSLITLVVNVIIGLQLIFNPAQLSNLGTLMA